MKIKDIILEAKPHPRGPKTARLERLISQIKNNQRGPIDWNGGKDYSHRALVRDLLIKTFGFNMRYWLITKYGPSKGTVHNKAFRGALAAWQSLVGLEADGIIGLKTLETIKTMLDNGFTNGTAWTNQRVNRKIQQFRKAYGVPQIVVDMAQAVENGDLTHFHSVYNCYYSPTTEVGQGIFQVQGNNWKSTVSGGYAKGVSGNVHDLTNFHIDNQVKIGLSSLSRSYQEALKDVGGDKNKLKVSDVLKYHNSKSWAKNKVMSAGLYNKNVFQVEKRKRQSDDQHIYTVQSGDTLYSLAKSFGISIMDIQRANDMKGTNIQIGQEIVIPTDNKSPIQKFTDQKKKQNKGMFSQIGKAISDLF